MESIPQHGQPAWRSVTALWRSINRAKGAGAPRHHPDVSFRGAKRRGALGAKREEVPLGCNLGEGICSPYKPSPNEHAAKFDCERRSVTAFVEEH